MEQIKRYPNGLRVVLCQTPGLFSVSTGIYAGVGSADETEGENGISHFIEHMMFKGTRKRSAFEIVDAVDSIGAQINAFTTKECTCYYTKSTLDHFETTLEILSDLVFHSVYAEEEMEREKGVVREEISMVEDTPDDLVSDLLARACFGDHPLGRPILGPAENVSAFTRDQLFAYVKKNYQPADLVLSVAGNLTMAEVERCVEKVLLPNLPDSPGTMPERKTAPLRGPETVFKVKENEQTNLMLAFPGPSFDDPRTNEFALLNSVFGGGMSSRLFQTVREKKGLAYSVYSYPSAYQKNGLFTVYAGVSPKNAEACVRTIAEEIRRFSREGITRQEFERGKEQLKSAFVFGQENTATIMSVYGKYLLMTDKLFSMEDKVKKIADLDYDRVQSLAAEMFDLSHAAAAYVGPELSQDLVKLLD